MKIRKLLALVGALLFCSAAVLAADMIKHDVADLGLTLKLPATYTYVFTRDMDADDPRPHGFGPDQRGSFSK